MLSDFGALLSKFGQSLLNLLPTSPLSGVIKSIGNLPAMGLGWLNWFFPVGQCLEVFALWLTALGVYYLYSLILRWVKAIN